VTKKWRAGILREVDRACRITLPKG